MWSRAAKSQALPTQDIPEIMAQSSSLLAQFQTILGRADGLLAIVENGQGNIGKLIKDDTLYDRLNATAGEVEQLVKDVKNSNGTISHLLYDDTLYNDIRKPIQRIDDMLAQVQQGKGTLGKAIYDPQLYDEARAIDHRSEAAAGQPESGQRHGGKAAQRRRDLQPAHADRAEGEYGDRQDQLGPGNDRATDGESAALRFAERDDAGVECAGQGRARESEEVPAHQAGNFLGLTVKQAQTAHRQRRTISASRAT